jgi:peptidoglycan/LPS O-acetylase OafA/YrhL
MRLTSLDVIRGLAALSVVITHISPYLSNTVFASTIIILQSLFSHTFWSNGGLHPGVIVFIVLSGFCIHLPVAKSNYFQITSGNYWKLYAKRRAIRILPVFFIGCSLGALVSYKYGVNELSETLKIFINPFWPHGKIVGNEILQTIVVELWLYAFYPITLLIYRKLGSKALLFSALLIYLIPIFLVKKYDPTWVGSSWYALYIYWVIGMLSADAACSGRYQIQIYILIGAFFLYILFGNMIQIKGIHYAKSLYLAIIAGLLFSYVCKYTYEPHKILIQLGEMSFTLYAIHLPLISLWLDFEWGFSTTNGQVGFFILLVVATITVYRLIELPSHLMSKSFNAKVIKIL